MKRETVKEQVKRLKEFWEALDEFFGEDENNESSDPSYKD